jgi:hypothetical protein
MYNTKNKTPQIVREEKLQKTLINIGFRPPKMKFGDFLLVKLHKNLQKNTQ